MCPGRLNRRPEAGDHHHVYGGSGRSGSGRWDGVEANGEANLWGSRSRPVVLTCGSRCCRFVLVDQATEWCSLPPFVRSAQQRCRRAEGVRIGADTSTSWRPDADATAGACPASPADAGATWPAVAAPGRQAPHDQPSPAEGRGFTRRSTATSCRNTSSSTSLDAEERPSTPRSMPQRNR